MPSNKFVIYAFFSVIVLTFLPGPVLGEVTKEQVDQSVANIDYFNVAKELAQRAGKDMHKLEQEIAKIHPTYPSNARRLRDLNKKMREYIAAGQPVPRKVRRPIEQLTEKMAETRGKIAKVARDVRNSSSGAAGFAKLGKVLSGFGHAQDLYQAINKGVKGYRKGGVDRAIFESGGSIFDNWVTGKAVAYGAGLGAPLGPPGMLVGAGAGLGVKYASDWAIDKVTGGQGGLQRQIGKVGDNTYGQAGDLLDAWSEERESVAALDRQNRRRDANALQKQINNRRLGKGHERWKKQEQARIKKEEQKRRQQEAAELEALKKRVKELEDKKAKKSRPMDEDKKKAEKERAEKERAEKERAGKERAEKERAEKERAEKERAEKERAEKERAEKERAEKERAEKERAEKERAEKERAEKERAEKERAEKEAQAQKVFEENLRQLGDAVETGMISAIKTQLRKSIDEANTQEEKDHLKKIVVGVQEAMRREAQENQKAMSSAIQRGQAAQRRSREQWGAVSNAIVNVLQQYGGRSNGRSSGASGGSTGSSGEGSSPGRKAGSSGEGAALCQQLQRQLEQNGNQTVTISNRYRNTGDVSLANELQRLRIEQQSLIRRMKSSNCPGMSGLPF